MITGKKVLAVIPARGGSKRVPGKNIRGLAGKPLIAWTIEEARKSQYIDRLILSSEDEAIIKVAETYKCEVPFRRPSSLAQDDTPGIAPVLHAARKLPDYDLIVLLQPTSPLRMADDIDKAMETCVHAGYKTCISVSKVDKSPHWMYEIDDRNVLRPFFPLTGAARRQDAPVVYAANGAVYVACREKLLREKSFRSKGAVAYEMPAERAVDIDTELDFLLCEFLMKTMRGIC
ncbi:N-acylneuraminate cytidylyltransferase [Evansella caseinilytica]|uniref:N-acylneuraminate cytidylyltransferase n=1 Tax=Evansella caseinilytica TaxID=1503961 RepID=A0A1H3HRA4_9BACI|nr:acylneuraminate cytidylyltransferase family protein [Evansella caseinilytica]SDY17775.1 N-acylneuraminate cytidylyltransferase [Evansella caseinilytica]